MEKQIKIQCKNNNVEKYYPMGITLREILDDMKIQSSSKIVAAKVNNKMEDLHFEIYKPKKVDFVNIGNSSGMRVYVRSLIMVFYKAIQELFPGVSLRVEHPISKGYYCKLNNIEHKFTDENIALVKSKMQEIIQEDIPFIKVEEESEKIIQMFAENGRNDIVDLLKSLGQNYSEYYRLGQTVDYYNGVLVPSTRYLSVFNLILYKDGVLLQIPSKSDPSKLDKYVEQDKMFEVFKEYIEWSQITGLNNVGDLNRFFKKDKEEHGEKTGMLIKVSEAMHEKRISQMSDIIYSYKDKIRIILISGPSSSGKTTLSKRLAIQLMANGLMPVTLSLDNYFVERDDNPKDANGEYDYESLYALDLDLFNTQLQQLLNGEEIIIPTFDFISGKKKYSPKNKMKITDRNVLILEGIHALNPELTKKIDNSIKFKIYVSALTTISLDNHNWVPTTDTRLLRRIIRDFRFRGYSAQQTISRWDSVRRGEEKWIFPYQENADIMFNSALLFELSVLKNRAEPVLAEVPKNCTEYSEAHRLLK
jgi:uridine kinase